MLRTVAAPATCPPEGHTRRCRIMATVGGHADLIEVMIDNMALQITLIDCAAPPRTIDRPGFEPEINPDAIRAERTLWSIVENASTAALRVWLPSPPGAVSRRRWEKTLQPNSKHPGFIFLDDSTTLNGELVSRGVCKLPSKIDRDTRREFKRLAG